MAETFAIVLKIDGCGVGASMGDMHIILSGDEASMGDMPSILSTGDDTVSTIACWIIKVSLIDFSLFCIAIMAETGLPM